MTRSHYLLLGVLVALTLAAVSPSSPPVRLIAGSGMSIITNALNSFTLSSSGGGSGTNAFNTNQFAVASGTNVSVKAGPLLTNANFSPSAASSYVTAWLTSGGSTAGTVNSNGTLSWQAAVSLTNTANVFVGDGSGLTGISGIRTLASDTTQTGNAPGSSDLQTYTLAANTLASNGDAVSFRFAGTWGTTLANVKSFSLSYDGTVIAFSEEAIWGYTHPTAWSIVGTITRTGDSSQKCETVTTFYNVEGKLPIARYTNTSATLSGNTTMVLTGSGPDAGDVTKEVFRINYEPAP